MCICLCLSNRPIRIVGHSLGAAVALIASFYLRTKGYDVTGLTLFGCPRICTEAGAKQIHAALPRTIRVSNYMDIVRTLPPGKFRHVGRSLLLFEDGQFWDLPNPPDVEPAKFVSHSQAFAHHRTMFYLKTLQSKVAEQMGLVFAPGAPRYPPRLPDVLLQPTPSQSLSTASDIKDPPVHPARV